MDFLTIGWIVIHVKDDIGAFEIIKNSQNAHAATLCQLPGFLPRPSLDKALLVFDTEANSFDPPQPC